MDLKKIEAVFNTWTFNNCWDNYVEWLISRIRELEGTIKLDRGFLISCPYCGEKMEERAVSMQILHIICCADKLIGDNTNRVKELEGTQWDRIANDLTEAKSENAKLLARVKELEDNQSYLKHPVIKAIQRTTINQAQTIRKLMADIEQAEARVKELEEVVKLTVESQGWDGNNPDDDRWTKMYQKAKASIQKEM